jgi:hypothetical protein
VPQSAQMSSKKWVKKRESSFVLLGSHGLSVKVAVRLLKTV